MNKTEKSTENRIGILVKTTLVDYPALVSCAFFLKNCNLRCPYCYNSQLVLGDSPDNFQNYSTLTELYEHLEKRKNVLKGFVLSGGEPLLNPRTKEVLSTAKNLGFKIKLDTNGTLPEKLEEIIENPETCPDYIALDIKTSPEKYLEKLIPHKEIDKILKEESKRLEEKILKSIKIVSFLPAENREFRTVLVPKIFTEKDAEKISRLLPEDSLWYFAHFQNKNCINPTFNDILPYSSEDENSIIEKVRSRIPNAQMR